MRSKYRKGLWGLLILSILATAMNALTSQPSPGSIVIETKKQEKKVSRREQQLSRIVKLLDISLSEASKLVDDAMKNPAGFFQKHAPADIKAATGVRSWDSTYGSHETAAKNSLKYRKAARAFALTAKKTSLTDAIQWYNWITENWKRLLEQKVVSP